MRLRLALIAIALLLLLPPARAAGDGPPTSRTAGPEGVVDRGNGDRLSAWNVGGRTVLVRTASAGGRVRGVGTVRGRWGIPTIAYDGTTGGLSADGRTIVLAQDARRLPRRVSRFAIVDGRSLKPTRKIVLARDWAYDALSPDGRTLYLTQSLNRAVTRYAVRAYDLHSDRLLREPVVDPSEPDEPLRGYPSTRLTGPGGRWEYTLYIGGDEPFIHALDTVKRTSICIDLPRRINKSKRPYDLDLELRGPNIAVLDRGRTLAEEARRPDRAQAGGGPPWLAVLVAASGLLAAAGVRRASRSGRPRR